MKLAEFNRAVNPKNEACYIVETPTDRITKATLQDIKPILTSRHDISLKMLIPKGMIVLELENENVVNAIKARNEQLMVAKKNNTYYIFGLSQFTKNTTNNMLACGVNANTLVYTKKGTEILLPFHSKLNTLKKYSMTDIIYDNGIGPLPMWLTPINNSSSPVPVGLEIPIGNNADRLMLSHVIDLASFTRDQQITLLKIMNQYLTESPYDEQTVNQLIESIGDTFMAEFMNKNEFYHDKFGDYVIKACHIKKDKVSGHIFFYDSDNKIYTDDPDFLRGFITKLCPRLKQYQKDEAIKYISDILEMDSVKFNDNPFNIVFKNGILHLDEMEFEPMSPEHLETIQINANYDPTAYSETADEFFNNVTCGDKERETLLYESIGYAMLKTVELAKMFMLTGVGRNGKSTFLDLLQAILSEDNCASLSIRDLANNFRVSALVGKLASVAADISSQPVTESDLMKSVASGDRITLEKKYENAYEGRVFATLFYACNKIPKTPDTSDGYYRRWVIIPFNADLTKIKNVEGFAFKKKLLSQESIDYVAYKAVKAIYNVFNTTKEFTEPKAVTEMKTIYKINNSSILSWFKEEFAKNKINPSDKEREDGIKRLSGMHLPNAYFAYNEWCKNTNKQALSRPNFEEEIKAQFGVTWVDNS